METVAFCENMESQHDRFVIKLDELATTENISVECVHQCLLSISELLDDGTDESQHGLGYDLTIQNMCAHILHKVA